MMLAMGTRYSHPPDPSLASTTEKPLTNFLGADGRIGDETIGTSYKGKIILIYMKN